MDVTEEFNRYETLLINIFEGAINSKNEDSVRYLITDSGITSEELSVIGYDEDDFPQMHEWARENAA